MPLDAEYAIDGTNEEEAICGGLITKVSAKKKKKKRPRALPTGPRATRRRTAGNT
jgi:hypothetical protein